MRDTWRGYKDTLAAVPDIPQDSHSSVPEDSRQRNREVHWRVAARSRRELPRALKGPIVGAAGSLPRNGRRGSLRGQVR